MLSKKKFRVFALLAILLIINTIYLYPWALKWSLFESSWIVIGTLGAIIAYYLALLSNFAPFQTFVMRCIFWGYSIMFFLSVMRRTFEYLSGGIPLFAMLNTILYLCILLLIVLEGFYLYNSYGKNKHLKQQYNSQIELIEDSVENDFTRDENQMNGEVSNNNKKNNRNKKKKENLTFIEGIGPVIQDILYSEGITTFKQLSKISIKELKNILERNDLNSHSPKTWPKQAELAKNNKWDELRKWQEELMGGRE